MPARCWGPGDSSRLGPVWSRIDASVDTGDAGLPAVKENTAGIRASLFIDQTDTPFFPTRGFAVEGSAYAAMESFGSARDYQRLEGRIRGATSWGPHTLAYAVNGGTSLGSDAPAYESFTLGGPFRLSAYRVNQFTGREYAYGRVGYYNKVKPLPDLLGSGLFAGGNLEVGWVGDRQGNLPSTGTLWSASAFLGAETFAGPAYLGVGFGKDNTWSLYLLLGAP